MARKSIKKNYLFNLSYQILLLITPLITTPYVSRALGADGIGTVSYAGSMVTYFTLFATLGITIYGQREISYVQDSVDKRSKVFWNTKILGFFTSGCAFLIYVIFSLFNDNTPLYLVLAFNILAVFVDVTWFFQGLEEFGKIVIRNTIIRIISILYIFIFVKTKDDILVYAFGLAVFVFLSNLSLWAYLPKYITKISKKDIHPFRLLPTVITLFVPTIAIQVYTVLDKTMIGVITQSSFENGYYEQALKISRTILTLVTALGTVMIPRIGYYFELGDTDEIRRLMYRGYRFVWFLGVPLCLELISVSSNLVPWFFGPNYDKVVILLKILALLILAIGINNVTGMQYLIPSKRQNIFTFTVVFGACVNFVLNSIFISLWQSIGAAIASVVAEMSIAVIQLIIVRKELSPLRVIKEGVHYYIAGLIMFGVAYMLGNALSPSILHTSIIVIAGALTYFAVLFIIKDQFFISNIKNIASKVISRGRHEV